MSKFVSSREAANLIPDHATMAMGGFCGFGSPDELLIGIHNRYVESGHPHGITLLKGVSVGDKAERGGSRIALDGLVKKVICSHVGLEPALAKMIEENRCLAYMIPLGTITELLRAAASNKPGVITRCGLETFADPRLEGSKANAVTVEKGEDIVSLMNIAGEDCLFYPTIPVDVCIIRGTYADKKGNIVLEHEALQAEQLEAAEAAHNSGGVVIVQVEDILDKDFDPRTVKLHHFMVDYIVKARPENHIQGYDSPDYRPEICGESRKIDHQVDPYCISPILFNHYGKKSQYNNRTEHIAAIRQSICELQSKAMPLNDRKVCGRRAAMELKKGALINLGIGMPDSVAAVADEEGIADQFTLSIESGVLGGVPLSGLGLGASTNPEAIYKMPDILNIYDGGGLDMAVLGLAEIDQQGNVNVSKFGGRVTGPGGFINIAQNTPTVIFIGTFTAGGLKTSYDGGRWNLLNEGRALKFKREVEQITFSGNYAVRTGKKVLVVTERAVFRLTEQGLMLMEIAPGVDLEKDVLAHMEFSPLISDELKLMDERIFIDRKMNLKI